MYAKARLDTLSDGIFAVAMTLLVLDLRLPDDFHQADAAALSQAVIALWPKFLPYALSFGVLGLRWLDTIELRSRGDYVGRTYVKWWLFYLMLVTCVPFTTMVLGRFAHLAPSIWLYGGQTLLMAVVGYRLLLLTPELEHGDHIQRRQVSTAFLAGSAALAIAISFVAPQWALWAFFLNFAAPLARRWRILQA